MTAQAGRPGGAPGDDHVFARVLETAVRLGLLLLLAAWCFAIARPFFNVLVWSVIIAIAVHPAYLRLLARLGGRRGLAASLVALIGLVVVIGPTIALSESLIIATKALVSGVADGSVTLPPPDQAVQHWPLVGEELWQFWSLAATNLKAALELARPQLLKLLEWLLATSLDVGLGILQFAASIVIAAVILTHGQGAAGFARDFFNRIYGSASSDAPAVAAATVRSVAVGILGVALIQAILGGLGMLMAGVPGAGLLALVILLLAVIQLPPALVLLPAAVWVFNDAALATAVLFLIWAILVSSLDTVLKPLLLGRGTPVPMLVVFVGAIGGFVMYGIVGLFTGAVVMSLGYSLFLAWLRQGRSAPAAPAPANSGET